MNITIERPEEIIAKYELEKAIKFNKRLLKDIACGFLFDILGSYNGIHLITSDYLINKYEKESKITILQTKAIEKIKTVAISKVIFECKGYDYSIIKQWIAETEAELVELVKKVDNTEGK